MREYKTKWINYFFDKVTYLSFFIIAIWTSSIDYKIIPVSILSVYWLYKLLKANELRVAVEVNREYLIYKDHKVFYNDIIDIRRSETSIGLEDYKVILVVTNNREYVINIEYIEEGTNLLEEVKQYWLNFK